jgi:hypothetical protein
MWTRSKPALSAGESAKRRSTGEGRRASEDSASSRVGAEQQATCRAARADVRRGGAFDREVDGAELH